VVSLLVVIALVGGVVYAATGTSPKKGTTGSTSATGSTTGTGGSGGSSNGLGLGGPSGVGVDQASTSARGVTADSINVAFPVSNLTSLASNFGFAGDSEFGAQKAAIHTFVNAINDAGGINGRKINPMIVNFDPTDEAGMRALCKQWTEGSPPVFAVLDGIGSWTGDNELCVTQEGHTPFIGQWTTVTNWTQEGAPYLWWTGPDQAQILATVVSWGISSGLLGGSSRVGVVAGDRTSDQLALNQYLLPDLRRAGITNPLVETLPSNPSDTAASNSAAPLVVQRLKAAGVKSVIPLIPFNSFFPFLSQENGQNYYPKLLLSDYESSIEVTLGLIPIPYEKGLDHQEGVTVETLGGTDAPSSVVSAGGYNPAVQSCYDTWKAHNKPTSSVSPYIEEQGPIVGWCQAIRLFATAALSAGPNLNRRSFVQAMSRIQNFSGTYSPTLSFGPDKFSGPTEYQVVELYNNSPPSPLCVPTYTGKPQGTCWHTVQSWTPLAS
ncbi:MAG TPA: ABC transporter substrate-binding protein, partial [Acidimicrobiales bacterium]|nr:ABC transporter substrate-binding protein [Acidimicrobiales bacterium]